MMKFFTHLILFFLLLSIGSCDIKPPIKSEFKTKINSPNTNDFYTLVAMDEMKYMVKVDTFTNDSIELIYVPSDNKATRQNPSTGELLLKRKPTATIKIAKSTLMQSGWSKSSRNNTEGKIIIPAFNNGQPLNIYDISRYASIDDMRIVVKDPEVEKELKKVIDYFSQPLSLEESLNRLDSNSINHLNDLLEISKSDDPLEIKSFILDSEFPEASYAIVLYTKYVFLTSYKGKLPRSNEELLQKFQSFYGLIAPGLWSMDFLNKEVKIKNSALTGHTTAIAYLSAKSNILGQKQFSFQKTATPLDWPTEFRAKFNLENEEWKMDLPSTYTYLYYQLRRISHNPNQNIDKQTGTKGERTYREMIRNEITTSNPDAVIDEQFIY